MSKYLFVIVNVLFLLTLSSTVQAVPFEGSKLLISCQSPYAVQAGKKIAARGGNVVDVAVTVALVEAVTSPYFAGLGGGGFALIRAKDKTEVLDFRETAPSATHPNFYLKLGKKASQVGGAAVGIPGIPAGLWEMHKKHGKLHWSRLFEDAIKYANKGFEVSGEWVNRTKKSEKKFNAAGKKYFFKKGGKPYKPGETLKQKELGKVLKEMRNRNVVPFYRGVVARDIVESVKKAGGVITMDDMKSYKVRWLEPMTTQYKGHKLYLMPPPSSGGIVITSALKMLEKMKVDKMTPFSGKELHHIGEILSRSFRGRALLGDPKFHSNPTDFLLSDKYITKMIKSIDDDETEKIKPLLDKDIVNESNETTHISVMDKDGNAVSMTITLNGNYGSGVVSEKYGVALNNEMDDFTTRPGQANMFGLIQGKGNYVQPGKRPLSSMSPTLVEKNGKIILAIGSPGGPKIISSVIQGLYRILAKDMDLDRALQAPRVHHQFLPHKLFIEKNFKPSSYAIEELKDFDHIIEEHKWWARLYAVRLRSDGILEAAYDSRGEGAVGGL